MNNFFFKIENNIKLTDILKILEVSEEEFLIVNKNLNQNIENLFIDDFVSFTNLKKNKLSFCINKIDRIISFLVCRKYLSKINLLYWEQIF